MPLENDELCVAKIGELTPLNIKIPNYQRPYTWSKQSVNTMFDDINEASKNKISEYRLGTLILHKEYTDGILKYNVIDGQQRLTTLTILLHCLSSDKNFQLMNEFYHALSYNNIIDTFTILSKRVQEVDKKDFTDYILNNCSMVKIVTDSEQEAFQFFDSQNSRGKELKPHDLLKSYHLREMTQLEETQKIKIINDWENIQQDELEDLFKDYLFPLTQWFKDKNGLNYSSKKIDVFKGISKNNVYNYAIYHKASNLFVEQFNKSGNNKLLNTDFLNQYQLTQPVISGKDFFFYGIHYKKLLEEIDRKIEFCHKSEDIPHERQGDIYILNLYKAVLMFYADKFGIENVTGKVMNVIYTWCYTLRIVMEAVYPETINKYALGLHDRANKGLALFKFIDEMKTPEDINLIILSKPKKGEIRGSNEKIEAIKEKLIEINNWGQYE